MSLDCTSHQSIHVVTSRRRPAPPFAESGAVSDSWGGGEGGEALREAVGQDCLDL